MSLVLHLVVGVHLAVDLLQELRGKQVLSVGGVLSLLLDLLHQLGRLNDQALVLFLVLQQLI
jgi:hypothetical protein